MNKIRNLRSPHRHPASNDLTVRPVQTVKKGLQKQRGSDIHCRLTKFLLSYRTMPQLTTGVTPAELLKWPGVDRRERVFQPGDNICVRNYGQGDPWLPGTFIDGHGGAMR
jgi:hypothetical protein